jgi:hypothetical protein
MILGHQHSDSSATAAAFLRSLRKKITTAKADISTLPESGHLNFALTSLSQRSQLVTTYLQLRKL